MKYKLIGVLSLLLIVSIIVVGNMYVNPIIISRKNLESNDDFAAVGSIKRQRPKPNQPIATSTMTIFSESFNSNFTVKESESMEKSNNQNWWLSSGGYFFSEEGVGSTVLGSLSIIDPWRIAYSISNPLDTDQGYHPQNIFRLVLKNKWQNFRQEAYFKIEKDNLSASPNRNASNGLLLFNRYQDAFNLYYTGIRVDGYAVIKKKINGVYYTMSYKTLHNDSVWHKDTNPNLLDKNVWIGLRSEVKTNLSGTVSIKLYIDEGKTGNWVLVAEAIDDNKSYGGQAFLNSGYAGVRTDFMDVKFDDYSIKEN